MGIGGYHIGQPPDARDGIAIIRTAIDNGVNFMDNSWDYHLGESELRMGKALRDGYRQKVFLMTKVDGRTRATVEWQLDESLKRLQTDHVDLLQIHEVIRDNDPDRVFGRDGAIEALLAAKKSGKIRFFGFSGHKTPAMLLKMIRLARSKWRHFRHGADAAQRDGRTLRQLSTHVLPMAMGKGHGRDRDESIRRQFHPEK